MGELGFTIETRAGIKVLVEDGGGCHPASPYELRMWKRIAELDAERDDLCAALSGETDRAVKAEALLDEIAIANERWRGGLAGNWRADELQAILAKREQK